MWRSPQARIVGPSLSRKNRLSAVSARKNAERGQRLDARRRRRAAAPGRPTSPSCAASRVALPALFGADPEVLQPALDRRLGGVQVAAEVARPGSRCRRRSRRRARPPGRRGSSIRSPAPRARGSRGRATASRRPATRPPPRRRRSITGITIVSVSASSQTAPTRSSVTPDEQPRREAEVAQPARRRADHRAIASCSCHVLALSHMPQGSADSPRHRHTDR